MIYNIIILKKRGFVKPMKSKKKWGLLILLIAVIVLSVLLYTVSQPKSQSAGSNLTDDNEIRFDVTKEHITNTVEVKGKSSYVNESILYAPFTAEVNAWHVEEGQRVSSGDSLFELSGDKLQSELSLAEIRILQQKLELKVLDASTALTDGMAEVTNESALSRFAKKEQDELTKQMRQLELKIAQAELKDLKERLSKQHMTAAEDGIFLFANGKKPDKVEQDQPIGFLVDLSELELVTQVSEYEVFRIKEGMEVEVKIDARSGQKMVGRVDKVAKFAKATTGQSAGSAQFEIRISLDPEPDLIAGLSLTGKIITDSKQDAIVVPTIAVLQENNQYYVYVAGDQEPEKRNIQIGIETADKTEVLEGLSEGEAVLLR